MPLPALGLAGCYRSDMERSYTHTSRFLLISFFALCGFFLDLRLSRLRGPNVDGARGRYALSRPTVPGRRFGVAFLRGQRLNATLRACVRAFGTLRSGLGGSAPGSRSPWVDNLRCIGQLPRFWCPGDVLWWHAPPHFCGRSCRATPATCQEPIVSPHFRRPPGSATDS